jgi:hypothetical protein
MMLRASILRKKIRAALLSRVHVFEEEVVLFLNRMGIWYSF